MDLSDHAAADSHLPVRQAQQKLKVAGLDRGQWRSRRSFSAAMWQVASASGDDLGRIYMEELEKAFVTLAVPIGAPQSADDAQLCIDVAPTRMLSILGPWDAMRSPLRPEAIALMRGTLSGVAAANRFSAKILIDADIGLPVATVGIGMDHVQPLAAPERKPSHMFSFLHLSDGEEDAGLDLLVEAFRYAFDKDDDASLVICVPATIALELARSLDANAADQPTEPFITVRAMPDDGAEVERLYASADVFVTASGRIRSIVPIQRAVAFGLPVIATSWGGHRDIADESNGWAVDFDYLAADDPERAYAVRPRFASIVDRLAAAFAVERQTLRDLGAAGQARIGVGHRWIDVARRILSFGEQFRATPGGEKPVVAYLTTWNTKCGIANASERMISAVSDQDVMVFAPREPAISGDQSFCVRSWNIGKESNDLRNVLTEMKRRAVRAIMIQFNYGFYNHAELSAFITSCADLYISVVIEFHSTIDPYGKNVENWCIAGIAQALRLCDRVLVHEVADMARMKSIDVVDNVTLFPLGTINYRLRDARGAPRGNTTPLIASYGFCFPNKGLPELVEAVWELRAMGREIRLKMLNAMHPNPVSAKEMSKVRKIVQKRGLQGSVDIVPDYLADDETLRILGDADLIVNPYQRTSESASASVRHGLSSGTPVAVTPLEIFNDLRGAVFQMSGISPKAMAVSIREILVELEYRSERTLTVAKTAKEWTQEHDYDVVGKKLWDLMINLVRHPLAGRYEVAGWQWIKPPLDLDREVLR